MKPLLVPLLLAFTLAGCASMGPATIARDRIDYVPALSDSMKQQTLLNLVRIRYADAPVFLDVASVINSYSIEGELSTLGQAAGAGRGDQFFNLGAAGRYADRPTITYAPLTGEKFARGLLTPFPLSGVLALMQSGYRADAVLRICVSSINGVNNAYGSYGNPRPGSTEFAEVLDVLRTLQASGGIDVHARPRHTVLQLVIRPAKEEEAVARRLRKLLGLDPGTDTFDVVHGTRSDNPREIAMLTRSMYQVLTDFASHIEVPESDLAEGRVYALTRSNEELRLFPSLLQIRSGATAPTDAYAAVRYRENWFWIEDRDVRSKTVFGFLLLMFSLTETGGQQATPVVTVPVR